MRNLDEQLIKCLEAEADAIPDRVLSAQDGAGENIIVMGYEVGAVCKDYIYSARSEDDATIRARAANSIVELSDVATQALIIFAKLRKLTRSMNKMTISEFIWDGLERQQDRMKEIKEKTINLKV